MSRSIRFYQIDAFTRERFRGNPAGVVSDARGLSPAEMQAIARELNNPETAFVVEEEPDGSSLHVRFFSPTVEVPLCGHATLATHYARAVEKGRPPGRVRQTSAGGEWEIEVEEVEGDYRVWLVQSPVRFLRPLGASDAARLTGALGIEEEELDSRLPVRPVDTGHAKVLVAVTTSVVLDRLEPDMAALLAFQRRTGWDGVQVFTLDAREAGVDVESRMFAPALGIPEDPVTGSGQGPMGAYLVRSGLASCWSGPGTEIVSVQGRAMGRPGTAYVRVECEDGDLTRVRVGGDAVVVFRAELDLGAVDADAPDGEPAPLRTEISPQKAGMGPQSEGT